MEPKHWLRKTESRAVASVSEAHRTAPHTHLQKPEPENFCSGTTDKEASRKRDVAWSFEMSRQINQRAPDLSGPSSHRRCQHQRQFGCEKCAPQRNVSETIKRGAVLWQRWGKKRYTCSKNYSGSKSSTTLNLTHASPSQCQLRHSAETCLSHWALAEAKQNCKNWRWLGAGGEKKKKGASSWARNRQKVLPSALYFARCAFETGPCCPKAHVR